MANFKSVVLLFLKIISLFTVILVSSPSGGCNDEVVDN